jgi:hypothetical protein
MAWLCALRGNPTIALAATDKVIGNLLGSFSAWDSNPIPPSLFVIDEDMRTWTLNSRLSFESHSIATGRVANLSGHPFFAAALRAFSIWNDRLCSAARAHLVGLPDKLVSPVALGPEERGAVVSVASPRLLGRLAHRCSH